nr:hypothetical protein [uncultured Flavobacterium sp.]
MKKIILLSSLFLAFLSNAQNNQIVFDNVLEYSLKSNSEEESILKLKYYLDNSEKYNLIEAVSYNSTPSFSFLHQGKYLDIKAFGFDRKVIISNDEPYYFSKNIGLSSFFQSNIVLEPIGRNSVIMGIPCEYFKINSDATEDYNLSDQNVCFCIDTKNDIKNLKSLLPNANIDGLVLAYGRIDYPDEEISLDAIKKIDIKIDFDFNAEYTKLEEAYQIYNQVDEDDGDDEDDLLYVPDVPPAPVATLNNSYYDDPLCNYYSYFDNFSRSVENFALKFSSIGCDLSTFDSDYDGNPDLTRAQAIQIAKKQSQIMIKEGKKSKIIDSSEAKKLSKAFDKLFDDATNFVPEVYEETVIEAVGYNLRSYSSDYKTISVDHISLAAEQQLDYNIQEYMPEYCYELKQNVPNFDNKQLKKHVYNLVGQICDLYLYQNGGSVDYFGTIDSMRKSLLEIENMRENLSEKDTKILNEYLNSLD